MTFLFFAPANARQPVIDYADFVTENIGGEGAFLDLAEEIVYNRLDGDVVDLY